MNRQDRIKNLVVESLESGLSAERVCANDPELVDDVRARLSSIGTLEQEIDALFPADDVEQSDAAHPSPQIPGYDQFHYLGSGASGIVFRARHLGLKRLVAIKMPVTGGTASAERKAAFLAEAENLATFRHPHIVAVYDVGESMEGPFIAMEYLDGGTLSARLDEAPCKVDTALDILKTIGLAVHAAHRNGILHRDLKPSNVLMTIDGIFKVTDFGLAYRIGPATAEAGKGPVQVGTPSYMSPEQARGDTELVSPASDVYSLGAILYEMLTGRPPFLGATSSDTLWQLLNQEMVSPSRLNPRIPRDVEIICLKALHRQPERRYTSAAEMVADIDRFQRGEPIHARATGPVERFRKWVKRRRGLAFTLMACIALGLVLTAMLTWLGTRHWQRTHEAKLLLDQAAKAEVEEKWTDARADLREANVTISQIGNKSLQKELAIQEHEMAVADQIFAIQESHGLSKDGQVQIVKCAESYLQLFHAEGLVDPTNDPDLTSARIINRPTRAAFRTAVDDWLLCEGDPKRQRWLLNVGRKIDADPNGLSADLRDPAVWFNGKELRRRIEQRPLEKFSVAFLLVVIDEIKRSGEDQLPTLLRAQRAHPSDYWLNITAGDACKNKGQLALACEYYRAAISIRPDAAIGWHNLGNAVVAADRTEEGAAIFAQAVALDPGSIPSIMNLGICMSMLGRHQEAVKLLRMVIQHDPKSPGGQWYLGESLVALGQIDEGMEHARIGAALAPKAVSIQEDFRQRLVNAGHVNEARELWQKALGDTKDLDRRDGYAELCLFAGRPADYQRECERLMSLLTASSGAQACEHVGRACVLGQCSPELVKLAGEAIDRAVKTETPRKTWARRYYLFAQGLAEYRQGHFDRAIAIETAEAAGVLGPAPRLVAAMAYERSGNHDEAKRLLADAETFIDWQILPANREQMIYHILRREARATVFSSASTQP